MADFNTGIDLHYLRYNFLNNVTILDDRSLDMGISKLNAYYRSIDDNIVTQMINLLEDCKKWSPYSTQRKANRSMLYNYWDKLNSIYNGGQPVEIISAPVKVVSKVVSTEPISIEEARATVSESTPVNAQLLAKVSNVCPYCVIVMVISAVIGFLW
jgi:hypothetical protein